jgi:hypothetical protein
LIEIRRQGEGRLYEPGTVRRGVNEEIEGWVWGGCLKEFIVKRFKAMKSNDPRGEACSWYLRVSSKYHSGLNDRAYGTDEREK